MMRLATLVARSSLAAFLLAGTACSPNQAPDEQIHSADESRAESVSLLESMSWMQVYAQKLILSAEAGNRPLVDFYLHELEELAEDVVHGVAEYDGHPIGELVEAMLVTEIERIEEIAQRGDRQDVRAAVSDLISACNACHVATDHGYIRITDYVVGNPFLQDFEVRE